MFRLPNILTVFRIVLVPVFAVAFVLPGDEARLIAFAVFCIAGLSDALDGFAARKLNAGSDFGRMLDPIADKLLVAAALMMLVGLGRLSALGLYPAIVIMLREILVSGLREYLAELRIGLPVTQLAKWKTGFQMGALGTLLAGDSSARWLHLSFIPVTGIGEIMLWVAAVLTLWTGWDYLMAGLHHASVPRSPVMPKRQVP